MPLSTRQYSGQPCRVRASAGSGGTLCGETRLTPAMNSRNSMICIIDGPIAPLYMSPTLLPSWSPSTISTSEGGISCAMVPEAAITPVAMRMS